MIARRRAVSPLLLCLVWMGLPRVGLAAQDAPLAPPPAERSEPVAAGDANEAEVDKSWGRPERYRAPLGLRLLAEVGAGLVSSAVGGLGLGLASNGLCRVLGRGGGGQADCAVVGVLGLALGAVAGYGMGVWWGGESMGGNGRLAFTLLGVTAGALVGGLLSGATATQVNVGPALVVPILLGAHLGYELFQRAPPPGSTAARPRLQPVFGFSSQGTLLGLGGQF